MLFRSIIRKVYVTDPTKIKPNIYDGAGNTVFGSTLDDLAAATGYANVVYLSNDTGFYFKLLPTALVGNQAGLWRCNAGVIPGTVPDSSIYDIPATEVQWGGSYEDLCARVETTNSDAADAKTQATTAATQATLARKYLSNKIEPNSSTSPTQLTYYDDNNTTPIGTRSISNGNNSVPTATQVLRMGKIT